jgi:hypothetical protein
VSGVSEAPDVPTLEAVSPAVMTQPTVVQVPENFDLHTTLAFLVSHDNDPDSALTFTLFEDGDGLFVVGNPAECQKEVKRLFSQPNLCDKLLLIQG